MSPYDKLRGPLMRLGDPGLERPERATIRAVPCAVCRATVPVQSATGADPECPEMLQMPTGASFGFARGKEDVPGIALSAELSIVVTCSNACLKRFLHA